MAEAVEVLLYVDKIAPGQQRFAQLMEQLLQLTPAAVAEGAAGAPVAEKVAPVPDKAVKNMRGRAG